MDSKILIVLLLGLVYATAHTPAPVTTSNCFCTTTEYFGCDFFGDCCDSCREGVTCSCHPSCIRLDDCCNYCEFDNEACYCGELCQDGSEDCCDHCEADTFDEQVIDNTRVK